MSSTLYWLLDCGGLATPDLTWEKVHQLDFGTDLDCWKARLNVGIDSSQRRLLMRASPAVFYRYLGAMLNTGSNAGEVSNKGFDIEC